MEKVLRLYEIPDVENIVTVLGSGDSLPESGFSENDLFINLSTEGLYKAVENQSQELEWVQIQFDETKYYRDQSAETPLFFTFSQQDGLNEYDVSFHQNAERAAEITSFTYSATRMGNAPTISGTLMYRQCLDELWTDRVCVFFNKKFYFIDKIPSSEFSGGASGINANVDERYKHQCEFVSENKLLENVYFTNVVDIENYEGDITNIPMQWLEFSFYGDIDDFISRLNLSLAYSGLDAQHVGFNIVKDNIGTVEEKLVSVSDTTIKAALDLIYETWEIPYWFDGYTIHIGYSNEQQMQQAGVVMPTFRYGATQSLLSLQKSQSNEIVNRITGFGSEENIPYFYPNKNPKALDVNYDHGGTLMLNYARISNPYRVVEMKPTTDYVDYHPNGTYFKYMPIHKTYHYDQFVSVNTHARKTITEDSSGLPQLVLTAKEDYNVQSRYFVQPYGGTQEIIGHSSAHPEYNIVCKRIWVWLHEGTLVSLSFKDEMNPVEMFDKGEANSIIFDETMPPRFFIKAQSYTYSRETYEIVINNNQGFSPDNPENLIDRYFNIRTVGNDDFYVWNNGTVTETYNEIFPINILSLPANTTCLSFTVGIMSRYNDAKAEPSYVQTQFKTNTNTVVTHELLSNPDWSLNALGSATQLRLYGIKLNAGVTPQNGDMIFFTRDADALPPFGKLLPYSFRDTNDIWINAKNEHYPKENGQGYYTFENLYKISCAKEHVENFEDIKPTIKGMLNNETPAKRIDKIIDVVFDQDDNNDLDASGEKYQHSYFYVKLAKTSLDNGFGFNLFDCAIDGQTMQVNMAYGNCGGCTFDVMVKYTEDGLAVNPIGLFTQATTINGVTYDAGTPYRDSNGNVVTDGAPNTSGQQDTSESEVWIALKKDNETFGSYDNGLSVVLPDSKRGQNFIPHAGDSFTITNICLPYAYIVAAEQKLYYALLDHMEKNNKRKWSFNIKFSSIYYKKHYEFMDRWLNESSRVPFVYNGITRTYYVQSYNYKMSYNSSLPEVTIELQEKAKKTTRFLPVPYLSYQELRGKDVIAIANSVLKIFRNSVSIDTLDNMQKLDIGDVYLKGDLFLPDGTSLKGQINAINSRIFTNDKINARENAWSKIQKRADVENLFNDGVFFLGEPQTTIVNASVKLKSGGVVGTNKLSITFLDVSSSVSFEQKIQVANISCATLSFYGKSEESYCEVNVSARYFTDEDQEIDEDKKTMVTTDSWQQKTTLFSIPANASYMILSFSNHGNLNSLTLYIDGVSIYPDNFTSVNENGETVATTMLPTDYKMSTKDILMAIDSLRTV